MEHFLKLGAGCLLAMGLVGFSAVEAKDDIPEEFSEEVTVITSEQLIFDYQNSYAIFEENVVVIDAELKLTADKLTVRFGEDGEVNFIEAKGQVFIQQEDRTARSELATYEVDTGKITLTQNPQVMRGRDLLQGETIIFWRDQNKMICKPKARLIIFPKGDDSNGSSRKLFGE